jgi:Uma2 family endonuclease
VWIEAIAEKLRKLDSLIRKVWKAYRQFTTLQEYVLVQPDQPVVEVFARNEAGKWELTEYGFEEAIDLDLGGRVAVKDLYDRVTFEESDEQVQVGSEI